MRVFFCSHHALIFNILDVLYCMFTKSMIALIFCIVVNTVAAQETSSVLATKDNFAPLALDTIVVTMQKREQPAQEVPISMTVLNEKNLEKARGNSLADIQQLVPGFSLENQSGSDALTIRAVVAGILVLIRVWECIWMAFT
jgi:outer membrane cobalamin receptor